MDEDLTMLIGLARNGPRGKSESWTSAARTPSSFTRCACARSSAGSSGRRKHTDAEIEEAASRFKALEDSLDPGQRDSR